MCEKNGDALCDTPAETQLQVDGFPNFTDQSCNYTGSATDNLGIPWPSTNKTNIMSYTRRSCLTSFSPGQRAIILNTAINRTFIQNLDASYVDADRYEPDNFEETARTLSINEFQCHSFNTIPELYHENYLCVDNIDWLKINASTIIGGYDVLVYEDFENNEIVGSVRF